MKNIQGLLEAANTRGEHLAKLYKDRSESVQKQQSEMREIEMEQLKLYGEVTAYTNILRESEAEVETVEAEEVKTE